jgi:hypothetical protein
MNTKFAFFGCIILAASASANADDTYTMKGNVTGYYAGPSSTCYVAINDPGDSYHKNQWLQVLNAEQVCIVARMAYFTQSPVRVDVRLVEGKTANDVINDIQSTNTDVTWPPYHDK